METIGFAEEIHRLISDGRAFVTATVVKTEGSSLAKPGFKVVVMDGNIVYGTLGGACPESVILDAASEVMESGFPRTIRIHLEESGKGLNAIISRKMPDEVFVETFCGGVMDVFLEPYFPLQRLIIIGQGGKDDIEDGLVELGKKAGFEVIVVDHAPSLSCQPSRIISDLDFKLETLSINQRDFLVILTKGERDIAVLRELSAFSPAYIGLMASRKRINHDFQELRKSGVKEEFLSRISAPIGIDIGSVTPFEIAISIIAQIIAYRRGKAGDHESRGKERVNAETAK